MIIKSRIYLGDLLRHNGLPLAAVEVGVANGIFSQDLLNQGIEKLYLVDVWEKVPFIDGCASFDQEWHDNNYSDVVKIRDANPGKVIILKGFSYKMANEIKDESLGLCYVDGDHTRLGAKADAEAYWPKLAKGGVMAFHDYGNRDIYGVFSAVENFSQERGLTVHELIEDGKRENIGAYIIKE